MIFKNIVLFLISTRFSVAITQNLSGMAGFFQRHFSGTDNLRVVSIILLLLAFVLFLFLVVILYIKSLLSFIKNDVSPAIDRVSKNSTEKLSKELERELEQENNLEKELAQSKKTKEKENLKNKIKEENIIKRREEEKEYRENNARRLEDNRKTAQALYQKSKILNENQYKNKTQTRRIAKDFDWRKGEIGELDEISAGISVFRYEPSYKNLDEMAGLILNMHGRGIDSGKIAQTIKIRCGDKASEEDIIQFIDSTKNFISLCNNGKFANLPDADYLPTPEEALYNLSEGDASYCLALLESLMNVTVDKGHNVKIPQKRDIAFMEASNYACTFGTMASLNDTALAISSFELAIELSPKNVNAWSRVADMYSKAGSDSKAIWAYKNVINTADEDIYPHQVANANLQLANHYYSQGDRAKASNLFNYGNNYYNSIGINRELTIKEEEIIGIIESKQKEDIDETISKLLNLSGQRYTTYR